MSGKILVTGGTGFLGGCVVKHLLANGQNPVVLSRTNEADHFTRQGNQVETIYLDLLDQDSLKNFLKDCRPKQIIHLAGYTFKKNDQSDSLEKANFEATVNLLEAAQAIEVEKIIITGTADEYGFQSCPQSEKMPAMPVSEYAISKNKAVEYALALYEKYALPVIILRPFTIYGVGQPARMFVSQAVECALRGVPFEMSGGTQKRDLVFVTDFADAMIKMLSVKNTEGEIFNLGSGKSIALRELAQKIWRLAEADPALLKIGARLTQNSELHDTQADISKIRAALNWEPKVSLEEGLIRIIQEKRQELNER